MTKKKSKLASPPATTTTTLSNVVSLTSAVQGMAIISSSTEPSPVEAVERVIGYRFKDKSLINQALTHCSTLATLDSVASPSYERLEFIGDAALGLALANFAFIKYPHIDPHRLSLLRSANLSTEKLARVAVRHGFFDHLLHSSLPLHDEVRKFTLAIQQEEEEYYYGGEYKAPKVLADIVESIAAAIYVDSDYNLKLLWEVYRPLLEPIVKLENLQQHPITMLYEACQKQGKMVDFKQFWKGHETVYTAIVDGKILGTGCSEQKDIAKLNAAKDALQTINNLESSMDINDPCVANGLPEIPEAKQKLKMFCDKKHWPNPMYRQVCKHTVNASKKDYQILRPGMILLKNYLTRKDQIDIVKICRKLGLGSGGFYQPGYENGAKLHRHMMCLGRNWDPEHRLYEERRSVDGAVAPPIPHKFKDVVQLAIKDSHELIKETHKLYNPEEELPSMQPDICIVNFYSRTGKVGLHQDRDESNGSLSKRLPVVSFSIGDSALFLYGDDRDVDKAAEVLLESGDVLIFGGKSRHVFHGVPSITANSAPKFLAEETNLKPGRLNLTFRQY